MEKMYSYLRVLKSKPKVGDCLNDGHNSIPTLELGSHRFRPMIAPVHPRVAECAMSLVNRKSESVGFGWYIPKRLVVVAVDDNLLTAAWVIDDRSAAIVSYDLNEREFRSISWDA